MNYNNTIYYLRRDHQGSITGLVNGSGVLVEEYSFDAWGSRRSPSNWANYTVSTPTYLYRGYTFHEHLDQFDLINMNGRAYDPVVGRFLSVDPVIQNGANTQNYNRYSYCLNNPLKYTDPSGYRWTGTDQENHNGNLARRASLRQIKSDLENWRTNQILGSVKIVGCAMPKPVGNNADGDGVRLGSDLIAQMITVISQNCVVLKGLFGGGNSVSGSMANGKVGQQDNPGIVEAGQGNVNNYSEKPIKIRTEDGDYILIEPGKGYKGEIDGVYIREENVQGDIKPLLKGSDYIIKVSDQHNEELNFDIYPDKVVFDIIELAENIEDNISNDEGRKFFFLESYGPGTFFPINAPPPGWENFYD